MLGANLDEWSLRYPLSSLYPFLASFLSLKYPVSGPLLLNKSRSKLVRTICCCALLKGISLLFAEKNKLG